MPATPAFDARSGGSLARKFCPRKARCEDFPLEAEASETPIGRLCVLFVFDASSLAGEVAQVKKPAPAHYAARKYFDGLEPGRVQHEDALDADAEAHLAHG